MLDDEQTGNSGLGLLIGGLILILVTGVIGFGVHVSRKPLPDVAVSADAPSPQGEPMVRIYYESGQSGLPVEAGGAILTVKKALEEAPGKIVLISGYHDPSGDPVQNAELAMERANGARDGLIAAGVPASRIKLRKPEMADGGGDSQEARRVEIRVQ